MSTAHIKLDFMAGEAIECACTEAIRIANMLHVTADFDFNGVHVMAKPGACPKELADAWHTALVSKHSIKIACAHPHPTQAKDAP